MGLFDGGGFDPNNPYYKGLQNAWGQLQGPQPGAPGAVTGALGSYIPSTSAGTGPSSAVPGTPNPFNPQVKAQGNPFTPPPVSPLSQTSSLFPAAQANRSVSQGPVGQGATMDWSQIAGAAPTYGGNLSPGDPGRKVWQQYVGNAETAMDNAERRGYRITGNIPSWAQGDLLSLNRYGQYGIAGNQGVYVPHTHGPTEIRPFTSDELTQLNNYQNYAYGQQNLPGGGGVGAWSNYLGQGGDPWGGAYQAYWANKAINAGVAPGAGYGTGTTAASSPIGYGPGGTYYNQLANGRQYFNQYGIPISGPGATVSQGTPGPAPNPAMAQRPQAPIPQVSYSQARLPIVAPTTQAEEEQKRKRQAQSGDTRLFNSQGG